MILLLIPVVATGLWLADWRLNRGFTKRPRGFARDPLFVASPIHTTVIVYLVFHYCWHMFWLIVSLPETGASYWHTPIVWGITLTHVERMVVAAMIVLVVTVFWFRGCNSDLVRVGDCLLTATEAVTLAFTMFAMPQYVG
ncbi:hypothetical protein [Novipirellula rosea]|uniref:Uncharacterized protein n=1 Tax=Novipirellula rosea TaxID=1031540 RepID=A0ABP8N9G2_9BACT